jgi:nucleoside-diphosphate-sugar epimerase
VDLRVVGDLEAAHWDDALAGVDVVVHLAARVHQMNDGVSDPLAAFLRVNARATHALACAAERAGVRRLVFASSIKVNGEVTAPGLPFSESSEPMPIDPYGISKHEAERALREVERGGRLEVTVLRPVLMYGPGVKGNLQRLLVLIRRGVPLPFASIRNRRSLLAVDNFVDAICVAASEPSAAGRTFLVADGEDLSTPELVRRLASAAGLVPRLVPVPSGVLRVLGRVTGRQAEIERLTGSLQVDASALRDGLGWRPPVGVDEGLRRMVLPVGSMMDIPG